jgi:neutral ceramidase
VAGIEVGAATANITPVVGVPMGGYGARQGVSTGIHDRLLARTVVCSDGTTDLAISVCDLVGVGDEIVRRARQLAETELAIPSGHIVVAATHTHSGPLDVRSTVPTSYTEQVARGIVRSIRDALESRQAVTLKLGTADVTTISQNRRDPAGPIERTASVLLATPVTGGPPIATLVNYACHSTVLEHDNMEYSPDFPGAMVRFLEREVGGTAVYLQGAAGNINPVWMRHDFADVERVGGILGAAATRVAHELGPVGHGQWCINLSWSEEVPVSSTGALLTTGSLAAAQVVVDLPRRTYASQEEIKAEMDELERSRADASDDAHRRHVLTARINQLRVEWLAVGRQDPDRPQPTSSPAEIQALRLADDCAIVTLPGEFFVESGEEIRRAVGLRHLLIGGYANGMIGYVPPEDAFDQAGYEVGRAEFEPKAIRVVIDAAVTAVRSLYP